MIDKMTKYVGDNSEEFRYHIDDKELEQISEDEKLHNREEQIKNSHKKKSHQNADVIQIQMV